MQGKIEAFIDSYEFITILVDKTIDSDKKEFYLVEKKNVTKFEIIQSIDEYSIKKYLVKFLSTICLNKDYIVRDELGNETKLKSGAIIREPHFEEKYFYDGPLGVSYSKSKTTFRIWSPVAKEIYIELNIDGRSERHNLKYKERGLWEVSVKGDLDGVGYVYFVRVFDRFNRINDPYALSASANAKMNYVVDPKKFYKMKNKSQNLVAIIQMR